MRRAKKERLFELFEFYSLFDLSEIRDQFAEQHAKLIRSIFDATSPY